MATVRNPIWDSRDTQGYSDPWWDEDPDQPSTSRRRRRPRTLAASEPSSPAEPADTIESLDFDEDVDDSGDDYHPSDSEESSDSSASLALSIPSSELQDLFGDRDSRTERFISPGVQVRHLFIMI